MVLYAIHDALVKPMPAGQTTPCLAESWSVSPDGLAYDFVLRPAKFHNGDPVTAEDVKFSFERYRGGAATLLKDKVKEVRAVDARRVRFVLKEAWPDFMTFYGTTATGAGWVVPKKYVERVGEDGFKKAPIGAGPYKFVSSPPASSSCSRPSTATGARRRASSAWCSGTFPTRPRARPRSSAATWTSPTT